MAELAKNKSTARRGAIFSILAAIRRRAQSASARRRQRRASRRGGGLVPGGNRPIFIVIDALLLLGVVCGAIFCLRALNEAESTITVSLEQGGVAASYIVEPGTTVAELMAIAGAYPQPEDLVEPERSEVLQDGGVVTVSRAFPVAVESAGEITLLKVNDGTVGDALDEAGVTYDVDDELSYLAFQDLEPGMQIRHIDVLTEYATSHKTLEYQEVLIKDDSKYEEFREVEVEGSDGLKRITQRITIKNGMEVSREIVDQTILTPAVNEEIRVGTKIRYQTSYEGEWRRVVDVPKAGKDGWVEMTVYRATGYCTGTRTATGTRPKLGTVAVNPKIIPYGTKIWVPKYGMCTAEDTGAFRNYPEPRNNAIDLWFNTYSEAMRWGAKYNYKILVKMG